MVNKKRYIRLMVYLITAACRYRRIVINPLCVVRYRGWLVRWELFCRQDTAPPAHYINITFYVTLN